MAFFNTMKQVGSDEAGGVFIDATKDYAYPTITGGDTQEFRLYLSGDEWFFRDEEDMPCAPPQGRDYLLGAAKHDWTEHEERRKRAEEQDREIKAARDRIIAAAAAKRKEILAAKQTKQAPKLEAKECKASKEVRCPYCHDSATGPELDLCDQCHALSHSACTEEHGGCAACGTKWELPALPAARAEAHRDSWGTGVMVGLSLAVWPVFYMIVCGLAEAIEAL